jgi:hypothetical protein
MADKLNKYQSYTEAGGKNPVEQNQRKYRIAEVIKRVRKGWSRSKILEWAMEQWDIKRQTASDYIKMAYEVLGEAADEVIENSRNIQLERLEDLLRDALESGDKANSLRALDMINRLHGLYIEKKEVKLDTQKLKFSFGDEAEDNVYDFGPEDKEDGD